MSQKQLLENRLSQLKTEYQEGTQLIAEKEKELENLRMSMYRIGGAIQVMEEMIAEM